MTFQAACLDCGNRYDIQPDRGPESSLQAQCPNCGSFRWKSPPMGEPGAQQLKEPRDMQKTKRALASKLRTMARAVRDDDVNEFYRREVAGALVEAAEMLEGEE